MSQILATFEFNTQQLFIILEGLRKLKDETVKSRKWADEEGYTELVEAYDQSYKEIAEMILVLTSRRMKMLKDQLKISQS
jgi:hypothetical protein